MSVVSALSQNSDYTEVRLLGFSYDFGVTVISHQNADAMVIFTARIKYKYIRNFRTSQGYIFFILQHIATNLCSFTHSKTLFLVVVLDFVLLALIKI